jgi:heme exporter protein C
MLLPLLLMAAAFQFYFFTLVLMRARTEVLERERRSAWVDELLKDPG